VQHYPTKKHHKVSENELRMIVRKKEQLAELQRERKRREVVGQNKKNAFIGSSLSSSLTLLAITGLIHFLNRILSLEPK